MAANTTHNHQWSNSGSDDLLSINVPDNIFFPGQEQAFALMTAFISVKPSSTKLD